MNNPKITNLVNEYYEVMDNLDFYVQRAKAIRARLLAHVEPGKKYNRIRVVSFPEKEIKVSAYTRSGYRAVIRKEKKKK